MKKYLFFLLALLVAACSTTHKVKTETNTKVDSSVVTTKDTSSVNKAQTYNDNFVAKGVDVTFDYDQNSDSIKNVSTSIPVYSNTKDGTIVNSIIKNSLTGQNFVGRIPSSVTVHIDSLSNTTSASTTSDSSTGKSTVKADVKSTVDTKTKDVTRTGMSIWVYLIGGLVIVGGLVFAAFKLKLV